MARPGGAEGKVVLFGQRSGYKEVEKEKATQLYRKITFSEVAHRTELSRWDSEEYLTSKGFKSQYAVDDIHKEIKLLNSN